MSYVHKATGVTYLAHPATGSTATKNSLLKLGFQQLGSHHSPTIPYWGRRFVFTVVRNHWDALTSWAYKVTQKEAAGAAPYIDANWLTWLFTNHYAYFQAPRLWYHTPAADYYLDADNDLQTHLQHMLRTFKVPGARALTLNRENVTKHKLETTSHLWDATGIELVRWLWMDEIKEMNFPIQPNGSRQGPGKVASY